MAVASWIKTLLEKEGAPYAQTRHEAAFTAQDVAQKEHLSGRRVAKVVVVMADERPVQLALPADRKADLEKVRVLSGAGKVRLAAEPEMRALFADCEPGAEPPLRHWEGVDLWMDESLHVDGEILFQAGTHQDAIRMDYHDWFRVARPRVSAFT